MQLKYVSTLYMYMYVDFYVGTCRTIRKVTPIVDLLHITVASHIVCIVQYNSCSKYFFWRR